jgi:ferredoxin
MDQIVSLILALISLTWLISFGAFGFVSLKEDEKRATRVAFATALIGSGIIALSILLPFPIQLAILILFAVGGLGFIVFFFLPIGKVTPGNDVPHIRYDERNVMFARARLQPGTPEYESYYHDHPENKKGDDRDRARPGLLSPHARLANPYLFASADASFFLTEELRKAVDGPVADERSELPPDKMTDYLKSLTLYYGALKVGVTELKPYHIYSHIGRGTGTYGAPIELNHSFAIAFTVEMDFTMMGVSPDPPVTMESARQYVEAARIAIQLAAAIRALGYPARAHVDGNYRVIAPLVGRDAGLGEIGRMGLLMAPRQGPRIRVNVVTTDAPLLPDQRHQDTSVIDFCRICKKCADNCPTKSISFDDRQEIDGALRWRINPESCYSYWTVIGTDCGRCMAVCPYSHPDNFMHNLVRWGNTKSGGFRRLANWMDDFFYGKYPTKHEPPKWTRVP